jgi:hypothetical protein
MIMNNIHVGHGDAAGPNQLDASHETCETYEMAPVLAETVATEDKTNITKNAWVFHFCLLPSGVVVQRRSVLFLAAVGLTSC